MASRAPFAGRRREEVVSDLLSVVSDAAMSASGAWALIPRIRDGTRIAFRKPEAFVGRMRDGLRAAEAGGPGRFPSQPDSAIRCTHGPRSHQAPRHAQCTPVKDLRKIAKDQASRIADALEDLADGMKGDVKRLADFTPEFRLRVGDYRVLFEVEDDRRIVVYRVRHRREAYRM